MDHRPAVELKNVSKSFPNTDGSRTLILNDINLSIQKGEIVAIVGYSGSGKTTLINLLAGLLTPDQGDALYEGTPIAGPDPQRAVVFQNYSLLPWLNVLDNVLLAVNEMNPNASSTDRKAKAMKYIEMVKLGPAINKKPSELSGGMRQRVSLARGLSMEPELLLLDEPLSALDALTRGSLQEEIARICEIQKCSIALITNDVDEGILMADRIIPMTQGPPATLGEPRAINIERPRSRKSVNESPEFQKVRTQVNHFLTQNGRKKATVQVNQRFSLPDILPEDLTIRPKWYQPKKRPQRRRELREETIEVEV